MPLSLISTTARRADVPAEMSAAGRADVVAYLLLNGAVLDDEVHALAAATAKGVEISRILLEYDQGELW